jgi:hypothetical protein
VVFREDLQQASCLRELRSSLAGVPSGIADKNPALFMGFTSFLLF